MAHRVGRPRAVIEQLLIRQVLGHRLVLLEGGDERLERPDRDAVPLDGLAQGDHHRVAGPAVVQAVELAPPPVEQLERPPGIADLVAQVVGPSAEGVDAAERRPMLAAA